MYRGWKKISIKDLEWDYETNEQWLEEKNTIDKINIVGKGNEYCLNKFAVFFTKSLDFIADPLITERKVPSQLFEIGNMMAKKMKHASQLEFYTVMRYVNGLKNIGKYHIGLSENESGKD